MLCQEQFACGCMGRTAKFLFIIFRTLQNGTNLPETIIISLSAASLWFATVAPAKKKFEYILRSNCTYQFGKKCWKYIDNPLNVFSFTFLVLFSPWTFRHKGLWKSSLLDPVHCCGDNSNSHNRPPTSAVKSSFWSCELDILDHRKICRQAQFQFSSFLTGPKKTSNCSYFTGHF